MNVANTYSRRSIVRNFLNGESGDSYYYGRLATREAEDGSIELVAYTNEVLARLDPESDSVEFFIGHHSQVSRTVTSYIKVVGSVLNEFEGLNVTVYRDAAPTLGIGARASYSAQYISNYVSFSSDRSAVERDAVEEVNEALKSRLAEMFGE